MDRASIAFDTPRCAFLAWRATYPNATDTRFREYYTGELRSAQSLRFVSGSNVLGPRGPDLVPVDSALAERFSREHGGDVPRTADSLLRGSLP
jgi:hypothetical protein